MEPQVTLNSPNQQLQDAKAVVSDFTKDIKVLKAGYKTTEFWIHLASQAVLWGGVWSASNPSLKLTGMSVSGVLAVAYGAFRTYLKSLSKV